MSDTETPAATTESSKPPSPLVAGLDELLLVVILVSLVVAFDLVLAKQELRKARATLQVLSPDASLLACSRPNGAGVFDLRDGRLRYELPDLVECVAFSPDSQRLLLGDEEGVVRLLEARSGRLLQQWKAGRIGIHSIRFHPDGELAGIHPAGDSLKIWAVDDGRLVSDVTTPNFGWGEFGFDPETGHAILFGTTPAGARVVETWDIEQKAVVSTRQVPLMEGESMFFVPTDGRRVAILYEGPGDLILIDLVTGSPTILAKEVTGWSVLFSSDGKYILSCKGTGECDLREVETGERILELPRDWYFEGSFRISPGGDVVVVAPRFSPVQTFDLGTGELVRSVKVSFHPPVSWPPAMGIVVWLAAWIGAYRLRRRRSERPTGRAERGVYLLPFVAMVWFVNAPFGRELWSALGDRATSALDGFLQVLLPGAIVTFSLTAGVLALLTLLLGFTERFRTRLIFTLPAAALAIWLLRDLMYIVE